MEGDQDEDDIEGMRQDVDNELEEINDLIEQEIHEDLKNTLSQMAEGGEDQ